VGGGNSVAAEKAVVRASAIPIGSHLSSGAGEPRPVKGPAEGKILAFDEVGGLHHRYEGQAA
jgi:hypothetical protein